MDTRQHGGLRLKKAMVIIVFIAFVSIFSGVADTIYAAKITDSQKIEYLLTDFHVSAQKGNYAYQRERYEHFDCLRGDSYFDLEFNKIASVTFIAKYHNPIKYHRLADVALVSGEKFKLYLNCYSLEGIDSTLGSRVRVHMADTKSIIFLHDGTFKKCPLCNTIFYNTELTYCSFDKEKLVPQHSD